MNAEPWPAPAKLNLFLHVVGRRPDGYHLLQTVFQFVDLCDWIEIRPTADGVVRRFADYDGIPESRDLVVLAARALQQFAGTRLGADISVRKQIPAGAGLGGGSSDAATALVGLNADWGTGLDVDTLAAVGLALGADVPVFVRGRAAWAEGVGERLTPVELPEPWYLIVHPGGHVDTARVFADPNLTRNTPPITIRDFLAGAGRNDCEPVVRATNPEVAAGLDWLRRTADARMTGTGACVFSRFQTEREARAVLEQLPGHMRGYVVRGRNRSTLLDRLDRQRSSPGGADSATG